MPSPEVTECLAELSEKVAEQVNQLRAEIDRLGTKRVWEEAGYKVPKEVLEKWLNEKRIYMENIASSVNSGPFPGNPWQICYFRKEEDEKPIPLFKMCLPAPETFMSGNGNNVISVKAFFEPIYSWKNLDFLFEEET